MEADEYHPKLVKRECGGWLAVSPADSSIRIGVTAPTKSEAKDKFQHSMRKWAKILAT